MEYNDYVIAFDENGTPYIAHAGFMDQARGAVNAAANRVQQVANQAKGVGRGVRQNHKYILKVNENGKTRYFYKQEEVKAYYEAKKRGIKNAAEYAQNAVKNKASEVADKAKQGVSNAKNAVREATGQAARDRMDAAAKNRDTWANARSDANDRLQKASEEKYAARQEKEQAQKEAREADNAIKGLRDKINTDARRTFEDLNKETAAKSRQAQATYDAYRANSANKTNEAVNAQRAAEQAKAEAAQARSDRERADKSSDLSVRAYDTQMAKSRDAHRKADNASRREQEADEAFTKANSDRKAARDLQYEAEAAYKENKAAYDKSLAGAVDRTAAKARDTASNAKEAASFAYNKAKDSANNAVKNAKDRFERMKGEFRDRAEQAGNAVKSTAKNAVDKAKDIAGYDEKERLDKATENKQSTKDAARKGEQYVTDVLNESPPGHRTQTQSQRLNAAVDVRNERWNAEDQARDEYWRARADYDKTPLAMVNRAKAQVSSAADSVRDKAEEAVEKLSSIPKAAKSAAEDVAFNVEYYSKQLKDGITGEKAAKAAANIREEVKDWKARADGVTNKELKDFYEQKANQAENLAKRFDEEAAKSVKGRINSATNSVQGMIDQARTAVKDKAEDLSAKAKSTAQAAKESAQGMIENARSSTAKAVNEAWDKIPKNADGTVNPFDSNFQSAYNDWKSKKDKYDGSLTGQAKAAAEKATDSVKDMIDKAKKTAKDATQQISDNLDVKQLQKNLERDMKNHGYSLEDAYNQHKDWLKTMQSGQLPEEHKEYYKKMSELEDEAYKELKAKQSAAEKATDSVKDMIDRARKAISNEPPKPTLSNPNNPIQKENIIEEKRIEEQRIPEKRIEERRIPEKQTTSYTKKPDPVNSSGARPYETMKRDAREAGIDFTAYDKAASDVEKLAKKLMREYREANEAPGPKSLNSKMWYDDPEYKRAVEKRKTEEEKLVKQLYQ